MGLSFAPTNEAYASLAKTLALGILHSVPYAYNSTVFTQLRNALTACVVFTELP